MKGAVRKRVLCLIQLPPPMHGVANINRGLIRSNLITDSFELDVLPIAYNKTLSDMSRNGVKKLGLFALYVIRLCFRLLFKRPKLVYFTLAPVGQAFLRDAVLVGLIKLLRVPLLFHIHGKGVDREAKGWKRRLYQAVFRNTRIVCLSQVLSEDLHSVRSNAELVVCANGVVDNQVSNRQDHSCADEPPKAVNILFFSNLIRTKGIEHFLQLCVSLQAQGKPFVATIAGDYSGNFTQGDLEAFFAQNPQVKQVIKYVGPLSGKEKDACFANADVLVHPSLNDAFPLVILEAMSASCALVCSDQGGIPEMLSFGQVGTVFPAGDQQALESGVSQLIDNREMLKEYKGKSRIQFEENYTFARFEQRMEQIFTQSTEKE